MRGGKRFFRLLVLLAQGGLGWGVALSLSIGLLSALFYYFLFHTLRTGIAGVISTVSMERTVNENERCIMSLPYPIAQVQ